MEVTKGTIRNLSSEINEALQGLAENHGMVIKTGSASYNSNSVTFKLECANLDEDGKAITKDVEYWNMYKPSHQIKHVSPGDKVNHFGATAKLIGYNPKARKYPIVIEQNGSRYKIDVRRFKLQNPAPQYV